MTAAPTGRRDLGCTSTLDLIRPCRSTTFNHIVKTSSTSCRDAQRIKRTTNEDEERNTFLSPASIPGLLAFCLASGEGIELWRGTLGHPLLNGCRSLHRPMTLVACEVQPGNAVPPVAEYFADKDESGGGSMLCLSPYVQMSYVAWRGSRRNCHIWTY